MLKKHMAACLVATALAAAPALAQTTPPPPSGGTDRPVASGSGSPTTGSSAMQPGSATTPAGSSTSSSTAPTAGSSAPQMSATSGSGTQGQFLTQMQPNQLMASKLIGTTVVGANNESIGDVNDVIVDRNGQVMAVVIGVGGFLGIGEKDVAVQFQQLDFASSQQTSQQSSGSTSGGSTTGSSGSVSTTGSTGTSGSAGSTSGTNANDGGVPDRVMLRMTKAELQAAPTFARSNRAQNGNATGSPATGATTPPKP